MRFHSPVSSLSLTTDSEDAQAAPAAVDSKQQNGSSRAGGTAAGPDVGDQLWGDEALPEEQEEGAVQTQQDMEEDEGEDEGEEAAAEEQRWRRPMMVNIHDPRWRDWSPPPRAYSSGSSSEGEEEEGGSESGSEGVEVLGELPDLTGVAEGREELWLVRLPPRVSTQQQPGGKGAGVERGTVATAGSS